MSEELFKDGQTPEDATPQDVPPESPAEASAYVFVRLPDGNIVAVAKSDVKNVDTIATATQDAPSRVEAPKVVEHFYVHLADGSVERVKETDLPATAGTNAPFGHWQRKNEVHLIIGVYPVQTEIKE